MNRHQTAGAHNDKSPTSCTNTSKSGFNSDLKVLSLYNTDHNKCKELLPTKFQFNLDKNLTWPRILDVVVCSFHSRKGSVGLPSKNVMKT
jgi:hypothetical protein